MLAVVAAKTALLVLLPTAGSASGLPTPRDALRLPAIVVAAESRSFVTIPVPVPAAMQDLDAVEYVVRLRAGVSMIGSPSGTLAVQRAASRALVITLRVPADLPAGPFELAEVEFRASGRPSIVQPVSAQIARVRSLVITGAREFDDLRPGDRLEAVYRVVNDGNAPEAVNAVVLAPEGWSVRLASARFMVVPRSGEAEVAAVITVPTNARVGDFVLRVETSPASPSNGVPTPGFRTVLRVRSAVASTAGLTLSPVVAAAASSDGTATYVGASLDGPLSEDVTVRARVLARGRQYGIATQGLSSVGAFGMPLAVSVQGRGWEASAGNSLVRLSDLAGINIIGSGVTASAERDGYSAQALIGRPTGGASVSGQLVGAALSRDASFGRIGAFASYLTERGGLARGRELTAIGADYRTLPLGNVTLGAGLAYRASYGVASAGYSLSALHQRANDRVELTLTHAPGGSTAFARATDEFLLMATRSLTARWSLDGSVNRSRDASRIFRELIVEDWSLGQRFELTPRAILSLRGHLSTFDARSATGLFGAFGAGRRDVTGSYEWRRGDFMLTGEGSVGALTRRTDLLGGRSVQSVAAQRTGRVHASRAFALLGALDASVELQSTAAGVGVPSDVWIASARWGGIPLAFLGRRVRLDAESQYQRMDQLRSVLITRSTVRVALRGGMDLALSAERNPYYRDAAGRAGWTVAFRISAATKVLSPAAAGPEGVVYDDRNRNGRRDPEEPGVPGVGLIRGDARAVTDRTGRYRLPSRERGRIRVDLRTLPRGLLVHPWVTADTAERRDIPLLATGTVIVTLRLQPDDDGRVPMVDLAKALLALQDETGFRWVGRRTSDTTVVFEDVPVGQYAARFDFSQLSEPLRFDEASVIGIQAGQPAALAIPLRGRAVRIIMPPSRGGAPRGGGAVDRRGGSVNRSGAEPIGGGL